MAVFTSAGIASLLGITAGVFTAGAAWILNTVVGLGLSYLLGRLAGEPEVPGPSVQGKLQGGGDVPRSFIIGEYITAGSLVYANFWGNAGKTPNAYFTQVIALSDLPVKGLTGIEVSGETCTLLTGEAHASYGYPVQEYRKDGTDYLWVKFYDGTQTTADSFLVSSVGSVDRPYSSNRVGKGIAYAIVTSRFNDELYSGFPTFKFIVDGIKLYDITKDTTAGGSGTQRWNDPNTWGGDGDYLTGVVVYNLLRGIFYDGDWIYGLQLTSAYSLPSNNWLTQIGKCRTPVDGPDGTEPSYRMGAEINISIELKRNIDECLTTCNGRISEIGGVYKLFAGAPDASVVTISDDDILSTEGQRNVPFFGLADTINGISARYPNPAEGWNIKPAPSIYRTDLEAAAGGRRLMADINFTFCPYIGQVERVSNAALLEAQRARRHTITLPPKFWKYEAGDIVTINSVRNGYTSKDFRLDGLVDKANLDQIWDITEIDPSDYSWDHNTDFKPVFDGPTNPVRPNPAVIENFAVYQYSILDSVSAQRRPAIRLVWNGLDQDGMDGVAYEVRLASDESYVSSGTQWNLSKGEEIISENLLPNEGYEVRARYVRTGSSGTGTSWSAWKPVTTPNLLINSQDIFDGAILTAKLADAAITNAKILDGAIDDLKIASGAVTEAKIAVGAVTTLKLADLAVTTAKVGIDAITSAKIQDAAIIASKIQDEAVTALKLGNNAVTEAKIAVDAVTSAKIQDLAITNAKIVDDAITSTKILDSAVIASKIATAAVTGTKIAAATIDATKFASGIAPVETLSSLPNTGNFEGRMVYLTTDEKLYRHKGTPTDASGFTASVDTVDLSGTVNADQIADNAVTIAKLLVKGREDSLILDPVFEDADLWESPTTGNSARVEAIDSASAYKGGKVLSFDWSGGATNSTYYWDDSKVPIDPNKTYLFEVVARKLSGSGTFYGVWRFFKADGTQILDAELPDTGWDSQASDNCYRPAGVNLSSSWERFTLLVGPNGDADLASNAAFVSCGCLVNYPGTTSNTQIGLFSIREATVNELITAGAIDASKIASGAAILEKVATLPNTGNFEGRLVYLTSDEKVYRHKGTPSDSSGFISTTAAADITGQLTSSQLADLAITTAKLADLAVTTAKIPDAAVIAAKVASNAITSDKILADAVTSNKILAGAITTAKIDALAVSTDKIAANAITTAKIAALAITADEIASNAITSAKINAGAITSDKIAANAIIAGKIAAGVITSTEIAAGAITTSRLAVVGRSNAINPDPNFEDTSIWTNPSSGNGGTPSIVQSVSAPAGTNVLLTAGPGTAYYDNYKFGIDDSKTYLLEWIVASGGTGGFYGIHRFFNGSGTLLGSGGGSWSFASDNHYWPSNVTLTPAYQRFATQIGANTDRPFPSGTTQIALGFLGNNGGSGNTNIGMIRITEVTRGELIVDGAIIADKIASNAVTTDKILASAITSAKIAAGTIVASNIASGTITALQIASNAIVADKIASNAVTSDKVLANAITTGKIAAGAVTATQIAAGAVVADKIASGVITSDKLYVLAKNLINDASIEHTTTGWTPLGVNSFVVATHTIPVNPFNKSYQIHVLSGNNGRIDSDPIPIKPDNTYRLQVTVYDNRTANGNTGNTYIGLWFYDASDVMLSAEKFSTDRVFHSSGSFNYFWYGKADGWKKVVGIAVGHNTNIDTAPEPIGTLPETGFIRIPADARFARVAILNYSNNTNQTVFAAGLDLSEVTTGQIVAEMIKAGEITASKIAAGTITGDRIAAATITGSNLVANTITSSQIAAGTITAGNIATGAITAIKIAAGTITGDKIAAGTITGTLIAASTIGAGNIAAGAITTEKLTVVARSGSINPDPNFEDGTLWANPSSSPSNPYTVNSQYAPVGTRVLMVPAGNHFYDNYKFGVDDTKTYLLEWIAASNDPGTFYGVLRFFNGVGTQITSASGSWSTGSGNYYYPAAATMSPAYQRFAIAIGANTTHPLPGGTTQASLGFLANFGGSGLTNIGMVRITEMARGELIVDGAVTAASVAANAITGSKIAAGTITAANIAAATITGAKIAAGTIASGNIAAGAVTADKITAANLAAISATLGAVNISSAILGSLLVGNANIANAAITSSKIQKLKVGKI